MTAKFSVLIPVYNKEKAIFLSKALESITEKQTILPTEIVLIKDGILTQKLENVIALYQNKFPALFKIIALSKNKGTGEALKIGVENCSNELIARMDADDISVYNRFEKQLNFIKKHPEIDVLGGVIEEFNKNIGDLKQYRIVPEKHKDIAALAKFRCPVNHPTVMFKKSKVLKAGNYSNQFIFLEDYALWIAMLQNKATFYNLQETLLHFRFGSGKQIIKKRSGFNFAKTLIKFNKYAYKIGFYSAVDALFFTLLRVTAHYLFPKKILRFFYLSFLRKKRK